MNDVDEIKNKLDIVEVIAGYIPLKQAGANWKGLSPFKTEKTPSFMVSAEKGIWHDFSTGKGGDVISFVMLMEGIEFREALELLAAKAGVKLTPRQGGQNSSGPDKLVLYEILQEAVAYFHLQLSKDKKALDYVKKTRGLTSETIKKYMLGYSTVSWQALADYLQKKGYENTDIVAAGLCKKRQKDNSIYDVFRNRIMFPVYDSQGRAIGFSARALSEDEAAKYINTQETAIYHKSVALYGLAQGKQAMRESDEVIVVEGNVDVLALAQAGYQNVVASSGTALTLEQLTILSRIAKNIKLCLDTDEAGINATKRIIDIAKNLPIKLMVIDFIDAKDVDELLQQDPQKFKKAYTQASYAPDFIIKLAQKQYDITESFGKKQFVQMVLPVVKSLSEDIEKEHYIKTLSQLLDTPESVLRSNIYQKTAGTTQPPPNVAPSNLSTEALSKPKRKLNKAELIEQNLAELLLFSMPARDAAREIDIKNTSDLHSPIFVYLQKNPRAKTGEIEQALPKLSAYVKILSLRGEHVFSDLSEHDARLEAFTQINRLNKIISEKKKRQLTQKIAQAESEGDAVTAKKLLAQYQKLIEQ